MCGIKVIWISPCNVFTIDSAFIIQKLYLDDMSSRSYGRCRGRLTQDHQNSRLLQSDDKALPIAEAAKMQVCRRGSAVRLYKRESLFSLRVALLRQILHAEYIL